MYDNERRRNDHREYALHFTYYMYLHELFSPVKTRSRMKSGAPRPSGDVGDFPELKLSDEQMGRRTSSEQLSESKLQKRAKSVTKVRTTGGGTLEL